MTEKAVQNIYNKLLDWESKRAIKAYPIHKKLNTTSFGYSDIYEWIVKTYQLNEDTKVLDAGCGVGYGSTYVYKHCKCNVTGISLSAAEVKKASQFAKNEAIGHNVTFKQQSFDHLKPNSYDFIMAIESVKHTLDINTTLNSLKNALKPGGILIIVDDFLVNNNYSNIIKDYAKDWKLKEILTEAMFASDFKLKKDITSHVQTKNSTILSISILLLRIMTLFSKVAPITKGGLLLEQLFYKKAMKYLVLEFKNKR